MTLLSSVLMLISVALAVCVAVCLGKGEFVRPGRALATFFRESADPKEEEFDRVIVIFGYLLSGLYWVFLPDTRWFVGPAWYLMALVATYRLIHIHEEPIGTWVAPFLVVSLAFYTPGDGQETRLAVSWFMLAGVFACWPTGREILASWQEFLESYNAETSLD